MNSKQTLLFYWHHAYRYPRKVWAILVLSPITLFFNNFLPPLIAADIIDKLSQGNLSSETLWQDFGPDLALFIVSTLLGGVVLWRVFIYFNWSLEALVTRNILRESFEHFMKLDASFHANSFGGSLVSQTNKLAGSYIRIADAFQFQIYGLIITLILATIILVGRSPVFVAGMWVFAILFFLFTVVFTRRVRQLNGIEARQQNKVTGYLADAITNVMAIKSFSASKAEQQRFNEATEELRGRTMDVMWATTGKELVGSAINNVVYIGALFAAIIGVVSHGANVSTVFLLLAYTANITERLWMLNTQAFRNINRGIGDARDGIIALQTESTVKDPEQPQALGMERGKIEFDGVTFAHDGNTADALFQNFNIRIKPGEKIGLVGHSGSGKTTFTRLLLRFSDVQKGEIRIDGQNIASVTQDDLRSRIAYVPQDPMLFHRSIAENILYGQPGSSKREVEEAAKKANVHEFVEGLPDGYRTLVGERGVKLSGGQRQRIAIARAMIKNAPILVLDEATSALDSESEALIQDALWKLMENRTAIVIAHRLSTIQRMDRIIVMDDGKIVEEGTHKELVGKKNGVYAKLWAHQSGGFIED